MIVQELGPRARIAQATMNLAQAAGSYTLLTATGDVLLYGASIYCTVVGATWTSVTVQTNITVPSVIMNSTEGARANFVAGDDLALTWTQVQKFYLPTTNRVEMTIAGATGTGTALLTILYWQITPGSVLA